MQANLAGTIVEAMSSQDLEEPDNPITHRNPKNYSPIVGVDCSWSREVEEGDLGGLQSREVKRKYVQPWMAMPIFGIGFLNY